MRKQLPNTVLIRSISVHSVATLVTANDLTLTSFWIQKQQKRRKELTHDFRYWPMIGFETTLWLIVGPTLYELLCMV